jgi:hypothetical protein
VGAKAHESTGTTQACAEVRVGYLRATTAADVVTAKYFILMDTDLAAVSIIADNITCSIPSDHESPTLKD